MGSTAPEDQLRDLQGGKLGVRHEDRGDRTTVPVGRTHRNGPEQTIMKSQMISSNVTYPE
jgi:hypothetical protein